MQVAVLFLFGQCGPHSKSDGVLERIFKSAKFPRLSVTARKLCDLDFFICLFVTVISPPSLLPCQAMCRVGRLSTSELYPALQSVS